MAERLRLVQPLRRMLESWPRACLRACLVKRRTATALVVQCPMLAPGRGDVGNMSQCVSRFRPGPETDSILGAGPPKARARPNVASFSLGLASIVLCLVPRAGCSHTYASNTWRCDDRHRRMKPAVALYHDVAKSSARVLSRPLTARAAVPIWPSGPERL